ncbi:hypothetical protein AB3N04_05070 [Alkalihalophilus sp. As8PL]|uniref:Uncharacterized protein n=1 Tax=Alkalihalophilus sp. As8PL TaxID=3237103 RepID=A0AB39BVI9_9BACI
MDNWKNNTIWIDEIPNDLYRDINLKEQLLADNVTNDLEYLTLWHYKQNKLGSFNEIPNTLRYLELNWANIRDFMGIEKLTKLKRLELHYCTKLEKDDGLATAAGNLEYLHINQSKKFIPTNELYSLKHLRVLCLNACGSLESLSFLNKFPNLIDFRFVNTNVLDGDLSPIVEHPTIRSAGFLNKKHYNIPAEKMATLLEEKNGGEEYKTIIKKKGRRKFYTERYNYKD